MKEHINHIEFNNIKIDILRLDKIHPQIQGNKYYKLKYNIEEAKLLKKQTLISFGGAYSNHISALAKYGNIENLNTIGIIRVNEDEKLSLTLKEAQQNGMKFIFCNRTDFRNFRKFLSSDLKNFNQLLKKYIPKINTLNAYIIPEGGTNQLAIKGTKEILNSINQKYDYITCPIGTAGTITGIISSAPNSKIIGFPALKGNFFSKEIKQLLESVDYKQENTEWEINSKYHFGAYAAFNNELINFLNWFYKKYHIPLDPIYTGKMFYGIFDMIKKNEFKKSSNILSIHTGGLQGVKGFNEKNKNLLQY